MHRDLASIVEKLRLEPHPEGGYFRQVHRSDTKVEHVGIPAGHDRDRRACTLIYFLLGPDDFSAFHRVRWTEEIWHVYSGGPLELHIIDADGRYSKNVLTCDLGTGEPAFVVPAGAWQAARPVPSAPWVLCGCTVAPGFEFADFQMPSRQALIERFPAHADILAQLTRASPAA